MNCVKKLEVIRNFCGERQTVGLSDQVVEKYSQDFPEIAVAIDDALEYFNSSKKAYAELYKMSEIKLIDTLQEHFLNFYKAEAISPYVAIGAQGPWVITSHGAVIHDNGGYGMLGFGQNPEKILTVMGARNVMANVMTASFAQKNLIDALLKEIGHRRSNKDVFQKFLCLNSGSESVTVATRISDLNAKTLTDPGARYAGRKIRFLSFQGSFHGRTDRPAHASHSTREASKALATFRDNNFLEIIDPNNIQQLQEAFDKAEKQNIFFEMMFMEPVMGEGNPGFALSPEFYNLARELTKKHGTLLFIDSIQAGIRAHGCLSIVDYPGFENLDPPDFETYSKALNGGQYPLSVLGMTEKVAALYRPGVYGNTMAANPRALDIACEVLSNLTDKVRLNIQTKGKEFLQRFEELKKKYPHAVTAYCGTGLLCSLSLEEVGFQVLAKNCVEKEMRLKGIGVIHGGKNALRFTPHFNITSKEIDLIVEGIEAALKKGPVYR